MMLAISAMWQNCSLCVPDRGLCKQICSAKNIIETATPDDFDSFLRRYLLLFTMGAIGNAILQIKLILLNICIIKPIPKVILILIFFWNIKYCANFVSISNCFCFWVSGRTLIDKLDTLHEENSSCTDETAFRLVKICLL